MFPENLKNVGFKNYEEVDKVAIRAKIRFTKDILEGNSYNLKVVGSTGTGKSHLCVAVARTLIGKGYSVGYLTTGQLLLLLKSTYNKSSTKILEDIFKDLRKLDVLILDDLDSEAIGGNDQWRKSMLFEVVESRSGKPTIYTSNLTDADLPFAVGDRVNSRLIYNTKTIDLFTNDYRKRFEIR